VIGLQKTQTDKINFGHFRHSRLIAKLFIQGLILSVILIIVQAWLDSVNAGFIGFLPPIGFALLISVTYFAQPLILGVLNIVIINTLFKTKGWQVGFWLNGIFLLLTFTTINLLLELVFQLQFLPYVAAVDVLLSFPFGCIARFSNDGWKKPIE
jgi:hypothetical protein